MWYQRVKNSSFFVLIEFIKIGLIVCDEYPESKYIIKFDI